MLMIAATGKQHRRIAHPMTYCATCTRYVYVEDMEKHIAESDNHKVSMSPSVPNECY